MIRKVFVTISAHAVVAVEADGVQTLDRIKGSNRQILRSMISPVYANRFIREYILEEKG